MKIYTKTGDEGQTSLMGGKRVSKSSLRVQAYGEVDELNAVVGLAMSFSKNSKISGVLTDLQRDLFEVGAELSNPRSSQRVSEAMVSGLEKVIDTFQEELEPLTNFVLPSGSSCASSLHVARSVCRRAERTLVELIKKEDINHVMIKYVNRLSDLLFVMARYTNKLEDKKETKWVPK